jgi:hypothetical protein
MFHLSSSVGELSLAFPSRMTATSSFWFGSIVQLWMMYDGRIVVGRRCRVPISKACRNAQQSSTRPRQTRTLLATKKWVHRLDPTNDSLDSTIDKYSCDAILFRCRRGNPRSKYPTAEMRRVVTFYASIACLCTSSAFGTKSRLP